MSEERNAYVEKAQAKIDELFADMAKLEAKARQTHADARLKYDQKLSELRQQGQEARSRVDEIKNASGDAWTDVKDGCDKSWKTFRDSVRQAMERY